MDADGEVALGRETGLFDEEFEVQGRVGDDQGLLG